MRTLAGISFQRGAKNVCPHKGKVAWDHALSLLSLYVSHGKRKENYTAIFGDVLLAGAVPLCKATRNRELTEKKSSAAGSIVLSDLLRNVGIGVCSAESEESRSVCKKCARKIFNCCTMFHELESAVKAWIDEGNSESTKGGGSMEIPPADRHRTPRK